MNIPYLSLIPLTCRYLHTQGKRVEGNQEGVVDVKKMRTWRQYMNRCDPHSNISSLYLTYLDDRRGGFNRYLRLLSLYLLQAHAIGAGHWTRSSSLLP